MDVSDARDEQVWRLQLEQFFFDRAEAISGKPSLLDHVTVSAKDPRIAGRPDFHADLIDSLITQLGLDQHSSVLEVGCASGYIACGLAPRVGTYNGVDLASPPLEVARRMELENATFSQADGATLAFEDSSFDAAFAYDVFSNFPSFELASPLLREMLRVVRPGGKVMAGSITDAEQASAFQQHVYEVASELDNRYGPIPPMGVKPPTGIRRRIRDFVRKFRGLPPSPLDEGGQITNYNFRRADFENFADDAGLQLVFEEIHPLNPYRGYRFNVVIEKPAL